MKTIHSDDAKYLVMTGRVIIIQVTDGFHNIKRRLFYAGNPLFINCS